MVLQPRKNSAPGGAAVRAPSAPRLDRSASFGLLAQFFLCPTFLPPLELALTYRED